MNLFRKPTKPAAAEATPAAPAAHEPVAEAPKAPEDVKISIILDNESIVALIQQIFDFRQRTVNELYEFARCFASNVANSKTGMFVSCVTTKKFTWTIGTEKSIRVGNRQKARGFLLEQ